MERKCMDKCMTNVYKKIKRYVLFGHVLIGGIIFLNTWFTGHNEVIINVYQHFLRMCHSGISRT